MKNIFIYGTSSAALKSLPALALNFKIQGFVNSEKQKSGGNLIGLPVFHVDDLVNVSYDLIVIASSFVEEIVTTLEEKNIKKYAVFSDLLKVCEQGQDYDRAIDNIARANKERELIALPHVKLEEKHLSGAQLLPHREALLKRLPRNGVVAELGVANGDFTASILRHASPKKLYLVDIWGTDRYSEKMYESVKNRFSKELDSGVIEIIRQPSQDAADFFHSRSLDWVYIDTTHAYLQTKCELESYSTKIKAGGYLAGHDYTQGNWIDNFKYGVIEAVHEFCTNFDYRIAYLTMDQAECQSFAINKL
ncbi:class I SAM-dependent methyltransferase [Alteromonas sp. ASW11-130]|uniref:class I SAM-dependent methyltransferase n=1 Tax=Alteromonas sp. ASW11-130 TaxID=3015775 RepID=UPI00224188BF|nr:class I SAM-dependent methyltransferase [Alteromonas sp. ASW11-130]MCW8090352.1 class I SAM-dependent methyltransferase [Alteromonas sp. ASW11-130]